MALDLRTSSEDGHSRRLGSPSLIRLRDTLLRQTPPEAPRSLHGRHESAAQHRHGPRDTDNLARSVERYERLEPSVGERLVAVGPRSVQAAEKTQVGCGRCVVEVLDQDLGIGAVEIAQLIDVLE